MNAPEVISALSARETVRVTHARSTDSFRVELVWGDTVVREFMTITCSDDGRFVDMEETAEHCAAAFAAQRGLDVTRLDVP